MTTITRIVYPCPDDTLGDTSPEDCRAYRKWFRDRLQNEYPDADVSVTSTPGNIEVATVELMDDQSIIESLHEFGNRCWDRCDWEFLNNSQG